MTYNIIASGSDGNATVLNGQVLVDCGISMKALESVKKDLKLVLLTHQHGDHFKPSTVAALHRDRPTLRFGCCSWMVGPLLAAGVDKRQIDVFDLYKHYKYGDLVTVCPVPLPHNVPNCGYRLEFPRCERVFYATDCGSLDGISAQNYSLYLVEANHRRADLETRAEEKEAAGAFAYERRAAENHLSYEQAVDWLSENMGSESVWIPMHEHKEREVRDGRTQDADAQSDG